MSESHFEGVSGQLAALLKESAQRSSTLHRQFLNMRQSSLRDMQALIAMQIQNAQGSKFPALKPSLFNKQQLDAFGSGLISQCFGPDFARYDQRRIPRIPNGDLSMMSRVVAITGLPHVFDAPASIVVEYDVPADAWYFRDNAYPQIPDSLYMEIALQPCGFLSAYLDSYDLVPYDHFYFRNLDGQASLREALDLRGKMITTRARMLTSVVSSGTVIQKFAFELSSDGHTFYAGESSFGYFSAESMANQLGLDGGRPVVPAIHNGASSTAFVETSTLQAPSQGLPYYHLAHGQLSFLDRVYYDPTGGRYSSGYIYARRPINPADWFYPCHFYQDPVMPGSLGVEAILEAMQTFALANKVGDRVPSPHFGPVPGAPPVTWRYRGQITPKNQVMELEVHLKPIQRQPDRVVLTGDASLWVDGLRIYEINQLSLGIFRS